MNKANKLQKKDENSAENYVQELIYYSKNHGVPKYKSGYNCDYLAFVNCINNKDYTAEIVHKCR